MKYLVFLVGGLAASVAAAPSPKSFVVIEKREFTPSAWTSSDITLDKYSVFPLSIGLTQKNLENADDYFMDVADPTSKNYAKHWTPAEVADAFRPTKETVNAVKAWLADYGISEDRTRLSKGHTWIRFNATIEEAESLLNTKYKVYEHSTTKKPHLACDEYSVPATVEAHVDFITPTIHFDAVVTETRNKRDVPKAPPAATDILLPKVGAPVSNVKQGPGGPKMSPNVGANPEVVFTLSNCNTYITPACLRALYSIPVGSLSSSKSGLGIVEFGSQSYLQPDLDLFYKTFATNIKAGYAPTLASIDGGAPQTQYGGFGYNAESDLDLEYAIALVYPQQVTLYQVGDLIESGSFGTFLDAVDATYCTSGGGDDPNVDPQYPDPNTGGYTGPKACGTFTSTPVVSISYSYNEPELSSAYEIRQCAEYLKLGLQGITVLVASGDYGVASNRDECCTYIGCVNGAMNGEGTGGAYVPSFPSTCPYVTSVGATQIAAGKSVTSNEVACQKVILSGGGFSNVFAAPSYQSAVLKTYFSRHKPTVNPIYYNTGNVRAYPDISANGADYVVGLDGALNLVYGTSASCPVVASIITLINEQRVKAGKKVVGMINPVLYANKGAMNDITSGSNPNCQVEGFTAVSGWDPVTGLGTPDYKQLLTVFMALP